TLRANQIECGIDSEGNVCANVFNSPTAAGGAWPVGTPNAYIFNTGLQIAGIMGPDGGPWANDTVGAYFFDARGTQPSGSALTDIYSSLDPDDVANWPDEPGRDAYIRDASLYNDALLGRVSVSQQDTWVQYWDADPTRITNRQHPMGIKVTQRSLAWNYPAGNESILYFIYDFENATNDPVFQSANELQFFGGDNRLPDGGITISELYAAFSTDMDVADAGDNFSSAVLPFDLGMSYHGRFEAPTFTYSPDIFFPPFFTNAPGIVGVKYLRSPFRPGVEPPEEVGLTLFSATLNLGTGFPDPVGDKQLWRYLSGNVNPAAGDNPCSETPEVDTGIPETTERSICFLYQTLADTRFYQSSGPFTLAPGESATIVVAYIIAATVQTVPRGPFQGPSGIVPGAINNPGTPSFHPGFPSARGCDVNGQNCSVVDNANVVKPLELGAGWIEYTGPAPSGRGGGALEGPENKLPVFDESGQPYFDVVPGSLLGKSLVAQTIFDNKFLLGFSPEQPNFWMVPGNGQVTVLWAPSATENLGDPFFVVAGDEASALFNPNYREFDVEGYRVWRGTTPSDLQLIGQFDYENTTSTGEPATFTDLTCETLLPSEDMHDYSPSTPAGTVFGFVAGEVCPEDYEKTVLINNNLVFNNGSAGGSPGAGVVRLLDGSALGTHLITAGVDDWVGTPMGDTGVPFAFVDNDVVNNFTYFYAVSAFDVNSPASGPYTLASSRVANPVTPRNDEQNLQTTTLQSFIAGDDGVALDPSAPMPAIDPENGTFAGPIPPTNGLTNGFAPLVPRLLGQFDFTARIDSFKPDTPARALCVGGVFAFQGVCARVYLTVNGAPVEVPIDISNWAQFGRANFTTAQLVNGSVPFDADALADFGIPAGQSGAVTSFAQQDESINLINWEGQQNRRGARARVIHGGMRWFSGTEETTPDPTKFIRNGHLNEVDSVWVPIHHTNIGPGTTEQLANSGSVQYLGYYLAHLGRAADIRVTWQGGTVAVRDVTHNVDVPFSGEYGSSWGFLNADADGDGVISWWDRFCVGEAMTAEYALVFGAYCDPVLLEDTPELTTVALNTAGDPTTGTTATGFALYLNAEVHFFATDALPPDGTVWTLRSYSGTVRSNSATYDTDDPAGYTYLEVWDPASEGTGVGKRPPMIPGLEIAWLSEAATAVTATTDLRNVHTVPDPYLATSQYDRSPTSKQLMFVNLPPRATIRIYTLTGVLVDQIEHDDITGGGRTVWGLRNRNNQFVASGVYFYHVVTPEGAERVGKFTIVNFAGQN
ncbi:MAG: hypothetical protein R6X22_10600, partial [Gemmatimonadota bacterium]